MSPDKEPQRDEGEESGFSDDDREVLRQMVKDRDRRQWLIGVSLRVVRYTSATVLGFFLLWEKVASGVENIRSLFK